MSGQVFTARIDRAEEKRYLAKFTSSEVDHILKEAARVGGKAALAVLRGEAPIGTSSRMSQFYRRRSAPHGMFRKSVRAASIRGRGNPVKALQGRTVGMVIGPMGTFGFTRAWIEYGTPQERPNPWVERAAPEAFAQARDASEAVLELYSEAR